MQEQEPGFENSWQRRTLEQYRRKGFASASGFGRLPALLIVDFINAFTDPSTALGGEFSDEVAVTGDLLRIFRHAGWPVVYTTVAYNEDLSDGGRFVEKVPALAILVRGSHAVEVDERVAPVPGELVAEKQFASAFFGTDVADYLKSRDVDTVVVTGCTTSGCVRASALDAMQHGFYTIVVRDGVGDRARGPHEANLFDLNAKYADVLSSACVREALDALHSDGCPPAKAELESASQAPPVRSNDAMRTGESQHAE